MVAGFQGVSPEGRITTLGRGGSDTTAVAFAAAFEAERCDIYTDVDGIIQNINTAAQHMLGYTAEELVGGNMHALLHHTHADGRPYPACYCPIYAAFSDGDVHTVGDEVFWHKDGHPIAVEYTSTPIREDGRLVGAVVVFRDVSGRKETEQQHDAVREQQVLCAQVEHQHR